MLQFSQLSLRRGAKLLFENVNLTIFQKQKVGFIGKNGCGKSSLLSAILGQLSPDNGEIHYAKALKIAYLAQQTPCCQKKAIDHVLDGDVTLRELEKKLANTQDEKIIIQLHEALENHDAYTANARAASLLAGLGFSESQIEKPVNTFSGGWRMRLNLAQCLMSPADLLLLDEPTNHLDLDALLWLEKYLQHYPGSIILISHDRDFLDATCNHIMHHENNSIILYTGNYSHFETQRANALKLQQAQFDKQQKHIAHMMDYVRRFRYKASKAKQAQSRLKAIERMDIIASAQLDSPFHFTFLPIKKCANPLLKFEKVSLGYDDIPVLKNINLTITTGSRIGLLGPNGAGKSTLLKSFANVHLPLSGTISSSPKHLQIAYYAQHQLEQLDDHHSPLMHIQKLSPSTKEQAIRDFLGGFAFYGNKVNENIAPFSGGEKARLALAILVWQQPNLLLLDEPTNHLDIDMRSAIELTLQSYEGAMVLISHDRHLVTTTVDEYFLVANQTVTPFNGTIEDYQQWLNQYKKNTNQTKKISNKPVREATKKIQNRINKIEKELDSLQIQQNKIEQHLNDDALYANHDELSSLLKQQQAIEKTIATLEQEWLTLQEKQ